MCTGAHELELRARVLVLEEVRAVLSADGGFLGETLCRGMRSSDD